jgi:nucleoside diphosphate kinase
VIRLWRELIGPFDPEEARNIYPMSIRALFGTSKVRNAVHGSDTVDAATRELQIAFPNMVNLSRRSSMGGSSLGSHISLNKGSTNNIAAPTGTERTIAMIKAHILKQDAESGTQYKQDIIWKARDAGFDIIVQQEIVLTQQQANDFFKEHAGTSYYSELVNEMTR